MQAGEQVSDDVWTLLAGFNSVAGPIRFKLCAALALTVLATVCELLPYWLVYQAISLLVTAWLASDVGVIIGDTLASSILALAAWLTLALIAKYLLYSLAYFLSHQAAFQLLEQLRGRLLQRLLAAPLVWLQRQPSGDLKHLIMQDVERLEMFVAHHSVEIPAALVTPLWVAALLWWVDWRLALAALATVPVAALASAIPMARLGEQFKRYNASVAELNSTTVEYLRNMPVMKIFGLDVDNFRHMQRHLADYYRLITAVTWKTVPGWSMFVVLISANVFFLLPAGVWLLHQGAINLQQMLLALLLGAGLLTPLFKLSRFSSEIHEITASWQRIYRVLTLPLAPERTLDAAAALQNPQVCVSNLYYSGAGGPIFRDLNFALPHRQFTALVGPSGAGKSTLVKMLAGLLEPDRGTVTVGQWPVTQLTDGMRLQLISVASQEAFLVKGTLRENLMLTERPVTVAALDQALKVAQLHALMASLPDGLDTPLGERGVRLSGGERQRLAIARTLLSDAEILVFDEATAFADSLTEMAFYQALKSVYADKTLLVIAHRLSAIRHADQVAVLTDGAIQKMGPHAEVLQQSPLYQRMWRLQEETENWVLNSRRATIGDSPDIAALSEGGHAQ